MRVLITGGGGFLGSRIALRLAARGDRVIAFDTASSAKLSGVANVSVVVGDITDMHDLAEVFSSNSIDVVVHCAGIVGVLSSIENPLRVVEVNILGSLKLLESMRMFGVKRMIHISSNEVYGDYQAAIIDEEHALKPQLPYGVSKVAVEQLGRTYRDLYGLECINLRGAWIYAPDFPRPRLPNLIVDQVRRGEAVRIDQGGDSVMDYVHAEDFVDATLAALDCRGHRHDAYNIGSGVGISLFELAELIEKIAPAADISIGPGRYEFKPGLAMRIQGALDITRAGRELRYQPKISIRSGLTDMIRRALPT